MGSVSLVPNLMAAGLVDRLRLTVFPLTCGSAGRQHISAEAPLTRLHLEETCLLRSRDDPSGSTQGVPLRMGFGLRPWLRAAAVCFGHGNRLRDWGALAAAMAALG